MLINQFIILLVCVCIAASIFTVGLASAALDLIAFVLLGSFVWRKATQKRRE